LFEYSKLSLSESNIGEDEALASRVEVKNIGKVSGAEVVQFYIANDESCIERPVKELKGFGKVALKPGEKKTVTFTVDKYVISYFDEDRSLWIAEKGILIILAVASSINVKTTVDFELTTTYWWSGL
jgi:beta-glucosidase